MSVKDQGTNHQYFIAHRHQSCCGFQQSWLQLFGFNSFQIFLSDALLSLIYWIEEGFDLGVEPCLDPFLLKTQFDFSYVLSSVVFPNAFRQAFVDFYFVAEH